MVWKIGIMSLSKKLERLSRNSKEWAQPRHEKDEDTKKPNFFPACKSEVADRSCFRAIGTPWRDKSGVFRQALILLFFIIGFFTIGCEEKGGELGSTPTLASEIVEHFEITETEQGKKVYTLKAEKAYHYKSLRKIDVIEPKITFFNDKGEVFSILNAKKGRLDNRTSNLLAKGDVVVRTRDSTILYTDSLIWNQRRRVITTEGWVRIESPKATIEGEGLVSDASLRRIEITRIKGTSPYRFKQ